MIFVTDKDGTYIYDISIKEEDTLLDHYNNGKEKEKDGENTNATAAVREL